LFSRPKRATAFGHEQESDFNFCSRR
jgi:hypothetical protein